MNLVNSIMSRLFDVLMTPFELLGAELALILISGVVGIVCLILFKYISWQDGIKAVKDKIKGNMIAIRIYQDDLWIVFKAVLSVFGRNFQYLGLNFGPILPLLIPFALVLSQLVVRYAYDPLEVVTETEAAAMLPGEGTMLNVQMKPGEESKVASLEFTFPAGIRQVSPIVRSVAEGKAFVEVVAVDTVQDVVLVSVDGSEEAKEIVAGDRTTRLMQPRRTSSFWWSWLLPAESTFASDSPFADIEFSYPNREFAYLPGGEGGIVIVFFLASLLFGAAVLKPLKIQI